MRQIAQSLSTQKLLKINELDICDGPVTGKIGLQALSGAVVEFSTRTGIGFGDD
ncbi:MAG: hypothetical protein H7337_08935 [Rhizobacter sp.]|nr:hypothetical protein [Rhizobacter sp.]